MAGRAVDSAHIFVNRLARARAICQGRRVEHGLVRMSSKSVGRVRRNLRESSTRGKGICGRLPSHGKTENGVPNQLGSDVPRIVHGRRLLPIARWRLAVAAIAGTSEGRPLRGAPMLVAPKDEE